MFAVSECHKVIVQSLVSAGADVHMRDKVCGVMECVKTAWKIMCIAY